MDRMDFIKETCSMHINRTGEIDKVACYKASDLLLGVLHLILGLVGVVVNTLALYLFYKMGKQKPYYIVIVFETFTDLVVCLTALYSAFFLMSGRDERFKSFKLLCDTAGIVWNWNMVITPLLLSVAGLMRLHGVYWPHSAFLELNRSLVIGLCAFSYIYGILYACFPFYFDDYGYEFKYDRSVCDFDYMDKGGNLVKSKTVGAVYFALMGPIPMFLSLLVILVTNTFIVFYLRKRYKSSWDRKTRKSSRKQGSFGSFIVNMDQKVQSKQVVASLLMMTAWYMMCYSIIIFCNFKNFINFWAGEDKIPPDLGMDRVNATYFYAMYNFLAYLNSFVNPFILLTTGSSFRQELGRLSLRLRNKFGLLNSPNKSRSSMDEIPTGKKASLPLIRELGENGEEISSTSTRAVKEPRIRPPSLGYT